MIMILTILIYIVGFSHTTLCQNFHSFFLGLVFRSFELLSFLQIAIVVAVSSFIYWLYRTLLSLAHLRAESKISIIVTEYLFHRLRFDKVVKNFL